MNINNRYNTHFLMTTDDVKDYVVDEVKHFPSKEHLIVEEIGDGNINYVFMVKDTQSQQTLVIKQADKLLRASGRPLDLHRNKIEATILGIEGDLAPNFVPKVYHYHEKMFALCMEDISAYENMRKMLMKGNTYPNFADEVTDFMVETLVPTTDLVLDSHQKKANVKLFINYDCCDISEDLVFTKPYGDYQGHNHNIITEGNEAFVKETLYDNEALKTEVGILRNQFMNNTQALIHGDLHSGSIFINQDGIKVIDPEFAFYGPIGYDIGNVIGNLHFAWRHVALVDPTNKTFIDWVSDSIAKVFDLSQKKLAKKLDEIVVFPLYTEAFKVCYLSHVMSDALGYAGTEMIRRTVGDSKVAELDALAVNEEKLIVERDLVNMGIDLIMNRHEITTGKQIVDKFSARLQ